MMRKMKDSGVEWIGEIPVDWEVCKLGKIANISTGNTPPKSDNEMYYSDEGMKWIKADNLSFLQPITETSEHLNPEGIKIARIAPSFTPIVCCIGSIGKIGYCEEDAAYNQQLNAVRFSDAVYWKYGFYYLMVQEDQHWYFANGNVLKILNTENQKRITIPLPLLDTQHRIADYLDDKCAKIDTIIAQEQAIIEKLKAYKLSVITEAVTKGLNPDVPMKESGINLCNKIPEQWTVSRIKYLFQLRNEKNYLPLEEVRLLSLYTELGVFPHGEQDERGNKAVTADGYKVVYEKDIVVNIILAWMGAIGVSNYDGVTSPAYDIYKPFNNVNSVFYHYLFRTKAFSAECYKYGRGIMAMRWRTYSTEFKNIFVPVPPVEEQQQIVDYLDIKCAKVDSAIDKKQAVIDKLTEYKKSLIYEVVTGKKEV